MYILKVKKTNILYPFTQFYAPDSYKYKQKRKRGKEKQLQVHEDRTHLLYKRIIFDIRRREKK